MWVHTVAFDLVSKARSTTLLISPELGEYTVSSAGVSGPPGNTSVLPSVVAGLVDVPVIGLPTSIGYGFGAGGMGALTAMLQSCAPGLVVVNIDNGIGAGSTAALIANRAGAS